MSSAPIRILHLATGFQIGGAEMQLVNLVRGLDRSRFECLVMSLTGPGPIEARLAVAGIAAHHIDLSRRPVSDGARLVRLVRAFQPRILQSWLYHADLVASFLRPLVGWPELAWNLRCSNAHQLSGVAIGDFGLKALAMLSRFPAAVVANAESGRCFHLELGYRPRRWAVIPNGFDVERFRPDPGAKARLTSMLGLSPDTVTVGIVGRLDPLKDHAGFLRAAAIAAQACPALQVIGIGGGVEPTNPILAVLARDSGLGQRLHLLGHRDNVETLTAGLDIAVSSSISEGFPNAVGEAMACGVPCVVTDVGDSALLLGECGRVVPAGDPGALAAAIGDMVALGAAGRAALGASARARIVAQFSIPLMVERYARLYAEISGSAPAG